MDTYQANPEKKLNITVNGIEWMRIPVRTHVIGENDNICEVAAKYPAPLMQDGDLLFISEKCVACTQKRAIPMKDIKPRKLAVFLSHYVYKSPYGIGLGIPETMEMALRECGVPRILFAAAISVIGKILGKRGWFYDVAGYRAKSIDGPTKNTIPPYNEYVVLGPINPDKIAGEISAKIGHPVAIVDANDFNVDILGASQGVDRAFVAAAIKDNPLGQSHQQTPMGILRKA